MKYLPLFFNVDGQRIAVSGAGHAALAKLATLTKTTAIISVYDPQPGADMRRLAANGAIKLVERRLRAADLAATRLIYIANDDAVEARRVRSLGAALQIPCNRVDDAASSDFISPAVVNRDPIVVAIGSEGTAPVLVRILKTRIEALLESNLGELARLAAALRPRVFSTVSKTLRPVFWRKFFSGYAGDLLHDVGFAASRRRIHDELGSGVGDEQKSGRVSLIGAGPGDPDLLTMKARRLLDRADVILYDRLVDPRVLELARREAIFIEVGKSPQGSSWAQQDINAAMIRYAGEGACVARLKSGDPSIFGRADEEIDALLAAGVSFEVVPGITAASAAAASLGRSLTRRGRNSAVNFITAQDTAGFAEHDWRHLAAGGVTAVYMGVRAARFVQGRLLLHGAAADLPVTVVENAARPEQRVVSTNLENLFEAMSAEQISGPAILFIGLAAHAVRLDEIPTSELLHEEKSHVSL